MLAALGFELCEESDGLGLALGVSGIGGQLARSSVVGASTGQIPDPGTLRGFGERVRGSGLRPGRGGSGVA